MHVDTQVVEQLQPDDEQVTLAVEVLRMLADTTRLRLLWALLAGEQPVNALANAVGKPASSVSQHLAKLRMARLVQTRRHGTQVYYRVDDDHVRQLVEDAIHTAEHAGPGVPAHHRGSAPLMPTFGRSAAVQAGTDGR